MFRKMIPLAVAIVILLGCKKKPDTAVDDGKVDSDPNATYTIKLRDEQQGDKTEESALESGSGTGLGGKSEKEERKVEYTEHILEMPAGAVKPTKLTRTYKVAQKYDKKAETLKPLPYEGKTVTIEKKGPLYGFSIEGKKMDAKDTTELSREFSRTEKEKFSDLLPKTAVKVGESWKLDETAMKLLGMPFPIDMAKSTMTGKLTRAYAKDGKQWGVIALDLDLAVDSAAAKGPKAKGSTTGTVKINGTLETVIDGSSRDGTMKMTFKMDITGKDGTNELKITADMTQEKTVRIGK